MLVLCTTPANISLHSGQHDHWLVKNVFKSLLFSNVRACELCCNFSPEIYLSDNSLESQAEVLVDVHYQPSLLSIMCYVTLWMLGFNTAMVIRFIYWKEPKKNRERCGILRFSNLSKFLIAFPETDYAPNVCVGHFIAYNIALSAYLLPLTCLIYIFSTYLHGKSTLSKPSLPLRPDWVRGVKANSRFGIQMFLSFTADVWPTGTLRHTQFVIWDRKHFILTELKQEMEPGKKNAFVLLWPSVLLGSCEGDGLFDIY